MIARTPRTHAFETEIEIEGEREKEAAKGNQVDTHITSVNSPTSGGGLVKVSASAAIECKTVSSVEVRRV